jgi:hypothetical protein
LNRIATSRHADNYPAFQELGKMSVTRSGCQVTLGASSIVGGQAGMVARPCQTVASLYPWLMPDGSFKEFVPDQLGALPELRARAKKN